jgi:hypothetical protein
MEKHGQIEGLSIWLTCAERLDYDFLGGDECCGKEAHIFLSLIATEWMDEESSEEGLPKDKSLEEELPNRERRNQRKRELRKAIASLEKKIEIVGDGYDSYTVVSFKSSFLKNLYTFFRTIRFPIQFI